MKFIALFLFGSLFGYKHLSGQIITVDDVSEKINWRVGVGGFTELSSGNFISITYQGKGIVKPFGIGGNFISGDFSIKKYGTDLLESQSVPVRLVDVNSENLLYNIIELDKRLYIIYAKKSVEKRQLDVQCIELDTITLKPVHENRLVTFEPASSAALSLKVSPERHFALFTLRSYKKNIETFELFSIGADAQRIRTINYTLEESVFLRTVALDDVGSIYVVFQDKTDKDAQTCYIEQYSGALKSKPKKQLLDFKDKYVKYLILQYNNVFDKYYLFGTYANKRDGNSVGAYVSEIADYKNSKIKKTLLKDFDESVLNCLQRDGFAKSEGRNSGLETGFAPATLHTRSDGSMDLIMEYNVSSQASRATFFISGSMIDVHYKDNDFQFIRIPKAQRYANTNAYLSNYTFVYEDNVVVLYNEREDNLVKPVEKSASVMGSPGSSVLVAAVVNSHNVLERKVVWDNADGNYASMLLSFLTLKNNRILVVQSKVGMNKLSYRLGMMKIN